MCVLIYKCVCGGQRLMSGVFLIALHFIFILFSVKLDLTNSAWPAGQWTLWSAFVSIPSAWVTDVPAAGFYVGPGNPHAYRIGAFPIECLPAPSLLLFNVCFYAMQKSVLLSLQSSKKALVGILWKQWASLCKFERTTNSKNKYHRKSHGLEWLIFPTRVIQRKLPFPTGMPRCKRGLRKDRVKKSSVCWFN